jgi:hypothetical protein
MGLRGLEDVAESAERLRVTAAIERGPLRGPRAEDAIEEKEGNAEVLVHESLVVECPVMDVVGLAGGDEPAVQPGIALDPEVVDVQVTVRATAGVKAASSMHSGMAILRSSLGAKSVTEPPFLDADSVENGASIEAWGTLRH